VSGRAAPLRFLHRATAPPRRRGETGYTPVMCRRAAAWLLLLLATVTTIACAPARPPSASAAQPAKVSEVAVSAAAAGDPWLPQDEAPEVGEPGPVPVTRADPARGSRTAPVTLVVFSDFECPFCQRLSVTLKQLEQRYSPAQLRVVWKNYPLAFHREARPTAEAAMAVFAHRGPAAFWKLHDAIFDTGERLSPAIVEAALSRAGVGAGALQTWLLGGAAAQKVDADLALAAQLGVTGTPASFINGVFLSGAQPLEEFTRVIDAQLEAARLLRENGTPPERVYAALSEQSFVSPQRRHGPDDDDDDDDTKEHFVPVGDSPVRGKSTALVTLVMFGDFECPFCGRVTPTLDRLAAHHGDKLRFVWKNSPLTFHKRAEPAAELALEARAQKGDAAFWEAHKLLLADPKALDDAGLEGVAATMKLDVAAVKRAIASHKHAAKIEADMDLSEDLGVTGTPTFFVNGRKLVGAQPASRFEAVIGEEMAKAEALVAKGTPAAKVYETRQMQAEQPPIAPRLTVPPPGKDSPSKGAAGGRVVVQMFADFECPFCARGAETMSALIKAFPGSVRVVWRNLPLPMHGEAQLAAEAAMEAFAQKGATGFWKMHDLLLSDTTASNLDRPALERHAASLGLDARRFAAALDAGTHRAAVEADAKVAASAGIRGTPGFVVNGYFVSGAQPLAKFKKLVRRALSEAK
jgi:protein-disulfide isomerase